MICDSAVYYTTHIPSIGTNRPFGSVSSGPSRCSCRLSVVFRTSPSHLHCILTIPKLDADGVIANLLTELVLGFQ